MKMAQNSRLSQINNITIIMSVGAGAVGAESATTSQGLSDIIAIRMAHCQKENRNNSSNRMVQLVTSLVSTSREIIDLNIETSESTTRLVITRKMRPEIMSQVAAEDAVEAADEVAVVATKTAMVRTQT